MPTKRLIKKLRDSLKIPAIKPMIVEAKIPKIATTIVFKPPTIIALP
jgi:hypothetical protein